MYRILCITRKKGEDEMEGALGGVHSAYILWLYQPHMIHDTICDDKCIHDKI